MVLLRASSFISCLPLRSGIWILGLVGLVVAGFGAAGSTMFLMLLKDHPVNIISKISLFVQVVSMGLFVLISILGIGAAIANTHGAAFVYSKAAILDFVVTVPAFGYVVFAALKPTSSAEVEACLSGDVGQDMIEQFCQSGLSVVKGFSMALMGAIILVQFYAYIIASSWADDLFQDSAAYVDRGLDFSDSEKGFQDFTRSYSEAVSMPRFQDPNGKMYGR